MNRDYIHQCRVDLNEINCFYFCSQFLRLSKKKKKKFVKGANVIEHNQLKEAKAYCAKCRTYFLEKFHRFDTLSDDYFLEAEKLLTQYYPEEKPGISSIVYVTIDVSNE